MFYTVYQIKNIKNEKCYIGKHRTKDLNDSYFGSGTYLQLAFDDWGKDNFKKEILCLCENQDEMSKIENHLIKENLIRGIKLYNLDEYKSHNWNEERKKDFSEKMKEYWKDKKKLH